MKRLKEKPTILKSESKGRYFQHSKGYIISSNEGRVYLLEFFDNCGNFKGSEKIKFPQTIVKFIG